VNSYNRNVPRVLVVDDSKTILDLIRRILTSHEYEVETADNGAEALDKYVKFKPNIVTLDLAMPVIDGYETLNRLLTLDKNANIIMLTSDERETVLYKCLERGALGYIVKPFTVTDLILGITNYLIVGTDKNVVTIFTLISNKIRDSIRKIFGINISVTLRHIEVIKQDIPHYSDPSQIRVIHVIQEELLIDIPSGVIGFVTGIHGQRDGIIISYISEKDFYILFNKNYINRNITDYAMEFFNTVNTKILSEMVNFTHLILNTELIRPYDKSKDNVPVKQVIKAKFEVILEDVQKILIEVQVGFTKVNTAKFSTSLQL